MAAVRSKGNRETELRLVDILRAAGITGWRRHQTLPGRPDFVFRAERLAVFVDGCFWHGCPQHCRMPAANSRYWQQKISRNISRDRASVRSLKAAGWRVIRLWRSEEHTSELQSQSNLVCRLLLEKKKCHPDHDHPVPRAGARGPT